MEQPRLMKTRIQLRRSPASKWAEDNPVLAQGEPGWDTTNDIFKIGDGVTRWNDLPSTNGAAVTSHNHGATFTKDVPATDWIINHNLSRFPSVTIVDSAGSKIFADVYYLNDDTITISFSAPIAGKVYLN